MNNDYELERINRYLTDKMSDDEKKLFEQELNTDSKLRGEVLLMQNVIKTACENGKKQLKQKIQSAKNKYAQEIEIDIKKKRNRRYSILSAAASVIIILGIGSYFWLQQPSRSQLFHQHFKVPENTYINYARGTYKNRTAQMLVRASKHYDQKNYKKASLLFDRHLDVSEHDASYIFLSAISHILINDNKVAKAQLRFLQKKQHFEYGAYYYEALLLIKEGNIELAKQKLRKSIQVETQFADKARKIEEALRN